MKWLILFSVTLVVVLIYSCSGEIYNISFKGVVLDAETELPIKGAEIKSFCVFQQNIDKSDIATYNSYSDSLGNYKMFFNKGYELSICISANNYEEAYKQLRLKKSINTDTILLIKKKRFHSLNIIKK